MKKICVPMLLCIAMMVASCGKPTGYGNLDVRISHTANGKPLVTDTLVLTNEAGNRYLVTEIQWFISNITLRDEEGNTYTLSHREVGTLFPTAQEHIFYIDTNIPGSQTLEVAPLPCGHYTSISFTFGLDQDDNQTGLFTNPPESNMFWPEPLGGGYHYMKLNGKYLDGDGNMVPLNVHLGIGQNATHSQFYQNYFTVDIPIDFLLEENQDNGICIDMNIDNWFRGPHVYDFNTYGSAIMQNQEAQNILKENGNDVFSVTTTNTMKNFIEISRQIITLSAPQPHFFSWENMKKTLFNLRNLKVRV